MSAPSYSVVIVTWNSAAFIGPCLDALRASAPAALECIVVDNASSDGTAALVRERYPWVTLLIAGENLGFAAANNLGLRQARGRSLVLLNPDTIMHEGALEGLAALLERQPRAGAVGPRLLNADGSLQFSTYRLPTPTTLAWEYFLRDLRRPNDRRAGRYDAGDYEAERQVEGLLGACIMVRPAALAAVGALDERYRLYCEEVDWCIRLRRSGWEIWYTPAAEVVHVGGQSARLAPARSRLQLQRSRFRLYSRWYPPAIRLLLETITRLGLLYQAIFWFKQALRRRIAWAEFAEQAALSAKVLALGPSGRGGER